MKDLHPKAHQGDLSLFDYIRSVSDDLVSYVAADYTYQAINASYLEFHQMGRDEVIDHTVAEILGEEIFSSTIKRQIDRCLNGEHVSFEKWFEFSSVGRRYLSVTYNPFIPSGSDDAIGVVVTARDITEYQLQQEHLERIENELRLSQKSLKKAQRIASIGSWEWDLTTDITTFSDEYFHLFGFDDNDHATREDCLGHIHPDDLDAVNKAVSDALDSSEKYSIEYRINLPNGEQKHIHGMGQTEQDNSGQTVRFFGTVHDISDRKCAEILLQKSHSELERRVKERTRELQQTNTQLVEANQAKSQFLTRMSHELRTPLNAILGFAQLLQSDHEEPLSERQTQGVEHILNGGWHLLEVVNDLLDLAAIEANKIELQLKTIHPAECIESCIELMLPLAKERAIVLNASISDCNNYNLQADLVRLKQMLLNLLSNAIKYNHEGGRVTLNCELTDTEQLRISVTDTGPGIAEGDLPILFEPFNRLYLNNHSVEGTGIGLTITKQLIERMGGNIGVSSELGQGSTFWLEFPAYRTSLPQGEQQRSRSSAAVPPDSNTTILYIEDSPSHIHLMEGLIHNMQGVRLLTASTPSLGLELAQAHRPDIILTDIGLPDMDGFEVLEQLQKSEATRAIPVIAVSANAFDRDIRKGLESGFRNYLTKPLDIGEFYKAINELR
ncbi:hypothetical protein BOW53_16510 [Solemya pervernicosa gill symbiont]|uniref:histidine kinase n=2 Tax=Gammaproteobacteria incertae sedis TaxID=118884 RepID=A0A1T2KZ51_9GAMM|nr:ATP-binding protein [Candidatus Reidiella endopervernicosa]OOZ38119.1 hypothetical protein BOW53_16510 [Solemya pervernicosa gill symbiont]QKQ27854.1 response regulator [Candidatus Reidiella endopervernicosa]